MLIVNRFLNWRDWIRFLGSGVLNFQPPHRKYNHITLRCCSTNAIAYPPYNWCISFHGNPRGRTSAVLSENTNIHLRSHANLVSVAYTLDIPTIRESQPIDQLSTYIGNERLGANSEVEVSTYSIFSWENKPPLPPVLKSRYVNCNYISEWWPFIQTQVCTISSTYSLPETAEGKLEAEDILQVGILYM